MFAGSFPKSDCIPIDGSIVELVGVDVATLLGNAASLRLLTTRETTCAKHSVEVRRPIIKRSHHALLLFFLLIFLLKGFAMEGDEIL